MNVKKLAADLMIGAVIPVLVLKYGTKPMGELNAYLVSALIPVVYVAGELVITRKLNVITTFMGLQATVNGILAFWFVSGWQYALKDSAAMAATFLLLAVSAVVGRPLVLSLLTQTFAYDRPAVAAGLRGFLRRPTIYRQVVTATWGMALINLLLAGVNFYLNYVKVVAPFPSDDFNTQKAAVDTMTRTIFPVVSTGLTIWLFWAVISSMLKHLPGDEKLHLEDRIDLLGNAAQAATPVAAAPAPADTATKAAS